MYSISVHDEFNFLLHLDMLDHCLCNLFVCVHVCMCMCVLLCMEPEDILRSQFPCLLKQDISLAWGLYSAGWPATSRILSLQFPGTKSISMCHCAYFVIIFLTWVLESRLRSSYLSTILIGLSPQPFYLYLLANFIKYPRPTNKTIASQTLSRFAE